MIAVSFGNGVTIPWPADLTLFGIAVFAFVKRWVVAGFIWQREHEEKIQAQQSKDKLTEKVMDQAIPALERATHTESDLARIIPEVLEVLRIQKAEYLADRERRVAAEAKLETYQSLSGDNNQWYTKPPSMPPSYPLGLPSSTDQSSPSGKDPEG